MNKGKSGAKLLALSGARLHLKAQLAFKLPAPDVFAAEIIEKLQSARKASPSSGPCGGGSEGKRIFAHIETGAAETLRLL